MHWYAASAFGFLRDTNAFHRNTTHSAYLSHTLDPQFQRRDGVEPPDLTAASKIPLPIL